MTGCRFSFSGRLIAQDNMLAMAGLFEAEILGLIAADNDATRRGSSRIKQA
jgi:hypothetical protein